MVDSADALYGIPDVDPAALKRTADANPELRWVHTMAAGGGGQVKAAGLSEDQLSRIVFTTSAGVHGGPLAEFAVFGVLAGAKDLARLLAQQRDQALERPLGDAPGLGDDRAGRRSRRHRSRGGQEAGRARCDRDRHQPARRPGRARRPADPGRPTSSSTVPEVDAIVLTLPGTAATEKLIGAEVLAAVKPGTILVNVGRGTVVDEDALLPALRDGRIGFAALDVFATEPLPESSPLWAEPNVLVSPHTAALNAAEDRLIAELFAANATRLLDGDELVNVVDTVDFY